MFIVEDEAIISMMIEDVLEQLGCTVAGVAARLNDALEKARTLEFDCAILDINLGPENTHALAALLVEMGKPFVFASGYSPGILPDEFRSTPVLAKPFEPAAVETALAALFTAG